MPGLQRTLSGLKFAVLSTRWDMDRRHNNNPHRSVRAAGVKAAKDGLEVYACPYSHPAMRNSWLTGYAEGKQLDLWESKKPR